MEEFVFELRGGCYGESTRKEIEMKHIFQSFLKNRYDSNLLSGFGRAFGAAKQHSVLVVSITVTGLFIAGLEGSSIAIFGSAVGILTGSDNILSQTINRWIDLVIGPYWGPLSSMEVFYFLIFFGVVAQVLRSGLSYTSIVLNLVLTKRIQFEQANYATNHTMALDYESIGRYPAGQIATLVEQSKVFGRIVSQCNAAILATILLITYTLLAFWASFFGGLVVIVAGLILWVSTKRLRLRLRRYGAHEVQGEMDLWKRTIEFLNAPKLLRLFNATSIATSKINEARNRQLSYLLRGNIFQALVDPLIEIVVIATIGLTIIVASWQLGGEAIDRLPELLILVARVIRAKPQILVLNRARLTLTKLLKRIAVVEDLLKTTDKNFERTNGLTISHFARAISIRGVSFKYRGSQAYTLKKISFDIPQGKTIAITGHSGSGKSTLLNIILGLIEPTTGEILIDGMALHNIRLESWRSIIGIVEQDIYLLNTSIKDNIAFARPDCCFSDVEKAAKLAGITDFIDSTARNYDTVVGDRGYRLSGGQRQRLALARALVNNPEILILDEATNSLDSHSEHQIKEAIKKMRGKKTIITVAHNLSTIVEADWAIVLDQGTIIEQGPVEKLLTDNGSFSRAFSIPNSAVE